MSKTSPKLPAGVTDAELKVLVKKHGPLYPISVTRGSKTYTGLFTKPDLAIMGAAASVGKDDPIASGTILYNSCKVKVDPEMDADDEVKFGAIRSVNGLFKLLQAEVGEAFV